MKDQLLEALPLFVGAVLGVYLYHSVLDWQGIATLLALLALAGLFFRWLAGQIMARRPVGAVRLWQGQVLFPIALIALGGIVAATVVDHLPTLVAKLPYIDHPSDAAALKEQTKTISDVLASAFTALFAALFLDNAEDAEGGYWPPAQIRKAFVANFGGLANAQNRPKPGDPGGPRWEKIHRALHSQKIFDTLPTGWSYGAAIERARIFAQHI